MKNKIFIYKLFYLQIIIYLFFYLQIILTKLLMFLR